MGFEAARCGTNGETVWGMENLAEIINGIVGSSAATDDNRHFFRAPLTAFARADDPLFAEIPRQVGSHHLMPNDILAGVKTVVSFFIPFSGDLIKGNKNDGPVSRDWGFSYLAANALIGRISESLIERLTEMGYQSAAVPATHTFDTVTLKAGWSHRSAAYVAGLGRFGLNRMLIGPAGGAGRYGTVFTKAEIKANPRPSDDLCLYYKNGKCRACVRACPVEALTEKGFDRHKCYEQLLRNSAYLDLDGRLSDACGLSLIHI